MDIPRVPKCILSSLIIVSFLTSSFALIPPKKALAQTYGTTDPASSSGLGPQVTGTIVKSIPGCMGTISNLLKTAFTKDAAKLENKVSSAVDEVNAVPTYSKTLNTITSDIKSVTTETNNHQRADDLRKSCFNGIAINISREFLHQNTTSIINWVNSGYTGSRYEGSPYFVQNQDSFFKNLAGEKINAFALNIKDPKQYPYGKDFITGVVNDHNKTFEQTNRYSLDNITSQINPSWVSHSPNPFLSDFNKGGWSAWLGMTQIPANNPVGFRIAAADALSRKMTGTDVPVDQKVKNQIDQGNGFLGDERCADPVGVTRAQNNDALNGNGGTLCNRWESVTPGKLISEQIVNTTNSPTRQIEMSSDINAVLGSVVNAVLGQFTTNLSSQGLAGLAGQNPNLNIDNNNPAYIPAPSNGTLFPDFSTQPGSWLAQNQNFNISTDLTQAVIDDQRTYMQKLEAQNTSLTDLIKWTHQLDYCIPGPSPDWESRADSQLQKIIEPIPQFENWLNKKKEELGTLTGSMAASGALIGATVGSIFPGVGTAVGAGVGAAVGAVAALLTSVLGNEINESDIEERVAGYLGGILDVNIYKATTFLNTKSSVISVLTSGLNSYKEKINGLYFSQPLASYMPTMTPEARIEYEKIVGYQRIIDDNTDKISTMKGVINNLEILKGEIDPYVTQNGYDPNDPTMKGYIATFGQLTKNMVSGDDIAIVDDLTKETDGKTKYTKDILVGSVSSRVGCEYELSPGNTVNNITAADLDKYTRRQPYPFPVDHYYQTGSTNHSISSPGSNGLDNGINGFLYYSTYYNPPSGPTGSCSGEITRISLLQSPDIIGGLTWTLNPPNNCGVISRRFERLFGVY